MNITPVQKQIIRRSFGLIASNYRRVSHYFYKRLFEAEPSLRPLFSSNMHRQERRFMEMLALLVNSLDDPEYLVKTIQDLGVRHVTYGVQDEHYQIVREALMAALKDVLGDEFDDQTREAWSAIYDLLMQIAIDSAHNQPRSSQPDR